MKSFIAPEQFPYENKTGWTYDSGEYEKTMREAMRIADKEERKALYYQAWELITADAPWIFVCNDLQPMAFKNTVEGYLTNPAYVIDFTTITIASE